MSKLTDGLDFRLRLAPVPLYSSDYSMTYIEKKDDAPSGPVAETKTGTALTDWPARRWV
jgi:hypothetical protein